MTEQKPNIEQNESYLKAFDFFNEKLFDNALPRPMLIFSRSKKIIGGMFTPHVWEDTDGNDQSIHEIALNCNLMSYDEDLSDMLGILVHEMCHLWQWEYGNPSRNGYHNKEWSNKAKEIGLNVWAVDKHGNKQENKETGQSISTDRVEGGPFDESLKELPEDALFPWASSDMDDTKEPQGEDKDEKDKEEEKKNKKSGVKHKYTCAKCGLNAWAKPDASLMCGDCDRKLVEQKKND